MSNKNNDRTKVRIRGIYATALTRMLNHDVEIVQSSPTIRERFDDNFDKDGYDVTISGSDDRQGISVTGESEKVDEVTGVLKETARDTLAWKDDAPRSAVFNGVVSETVRGGAVVELGDGRKGYLPFSKTEDRIGRNDKVRVQVSEPAAPWENRKRVLDTQIRVFGGLVRLKRGSSSRKPRRKSLGQMAEMLSSSQVPDGWRLEQDDIELTSLETALGNLSEEAEKIGEALDEAPSPSKEAPLEVVRTEETSWVWFGRESRFELDGVRREVENTMEGHHRIKSGRDDAGVAVDFVESMYDEPTFDFGHVTDVFGPKEGDDVSLHHGKPDGSMIELGKAEVTDRDVEDEKITVSREMGGNGKYDGLGVEKEEGDTAVTKFKEGRWWYPTTYRDEEGDSKGTYINICTPVEIFPDRVRYVDLHVDIVKHVDGDVERVDDDELDTSVEEGDVPDELAEKARDVAATIQKAVE